MVNYKTQKKKKKLKVSREKTQITTVAEVVICPPEYILNLLEKQSCSWAYRC